MLLLFLHRKTLVVTFETYKVPDEPRVGMSSIEHTQENRETLGKAIAAVINDVFHQGAQIVIHWDLANAQDEHSGVYASAIIHESSVTRSEESELASGGLYLVEQAAHITENPDMDDSLTEIPRDELSDAAETDMELVLELEQSFIDNAL